MKQVHDSEKYLMTVQLAPVEDSRANLVTSGHKTECGVKRIRWVILVIVLIACVVLWTQTINVMCDQDVQFFSGVCAINKFIPW